MSRSKTGQQHSMKIALTENANAAADPLHAVFFYKGWPIRDDFRD